MSDLSQLENTLLTVAKWATSIPWDWEQKPKQMPAPVAFGILSGPDEVENSGRDYYKVDPTTGRASVQAWRTGSVQLRVISYSQAGNKRSAWIMQQLVMALALPDVPAAMAAGGLALGRIGAARSVDTTGLTARAESITTVDLEIGWTPTALQPTTDYGIVRSASGVMILDGSSSPWTVSLP